jgi:hypothetical protein
MEPEKARIAVALSRAIVDHIQNSHASPTTIDVMNAVQMLRNRIG